MKDEQLSRATVIRDPALGPLFASSRYRRILMLFAREPLSVAEAAARFGFELKRLHHYVQRLARLRLLEVCEVRPRAGRAIKRYRASSTSYFVPEEVLPKPFAEELAMELRASLSTGAVRSSRGMLLTLGPRGEPVGRVIAAGDSPPEAFELWRVLRLSRAELAELRREMDTMLRRFERRSGTGGSVYLVHAAAARRPDQGGTIDNP